MLHSFGIELQVITAAPQSPAVRMTVAGVERQARGAFFIVQINRRDGDVFTAPPGSAVVGEGDSVVLIGRPNRAAVLTSLFEARQRSCQRVGPGHAGGQQDLLAGRVAVNAEITLRCRCSPKQSGKG